jgi:hypothetical protein
MTIEASGRPRVRESQETRDKSAHRGPVSDCYQEQAKTAIEVGPADWIIFGHVRSRCSRIRSPIKIARDDGRLGGWGKYRPLPWVQRSDKFEPDRLNLPSAQESRHSGPPCIPPNYDFQSRLTSVCANLRTFPCLGRTDDCGSCPFRRCCAVFQIDVQD